MPPGLSYLAPMLSLAAIASPSEPAPVVGQYAADSLTLTIGEHVIADATDVVYGCIGYGGALLVPSDHGATPEERAVTRGPRHNPGRLTRRERRRRAGR